jgi:hypothetical protein
MVIGGGMRTNIAYGSLGKREEGRRRGMEGMREGEGSTFAL